MTPKLTNELQKAVDDHAGQPIRIEHPVTHKLYVIVDSDMHERAMQALRRQEDLNAIQAGVEAMEAGRTIPLAEADKRIREDLGFPPRGV